MRVSVFTFCMVQMRVPNVFSICHASGVMAVAASYGLLLPNLTRQSTPQNHHPHSTQGARPGGRTAKSERGQGGSAHPEDVRYSVNVVRDRTTRTGFPAQVTPAREIDKQESLYRQANRSTTNTNERDRRNT